MGCHAIARSCLSANSKQPPSKFPSFFAPMQAQNYAVFQHLLAMTLTVDTRLHACLHLTALYNPDVQLQSLQQQAPVKMSAKSKPCLLVLILSAAALFACLATKEYEEEEEKHNPYVLEDRHFSTAIKAEKGRVDILTKFTENSDLLRTIENYRLALLVANPGVFVVPNHFDADAIFVVTQGRGRITLIHEDKRQSFDIETGDIIRVRAGTPLYLVNSDDIEKLFIVKLLQHVNRPDHYDVFYGAEGAKPESFSTEILEATLKTSREKLESFFEKQGKDAFLEASKEQIEAMSSREEGTGGGGIWPFGTQSKNPFNLFRKHRPSKSNKYGQLFEVDADEFKLLKDFDLRVSYANISRGSMTAPFYNSRAIKISIVVQGQGYIEMVASKASRKSGYEKRSSSLRPDTVFVIPAGHPFVTVASRRTNLEILCFEVNIENNVRYLPAGEGNFAQRFEKEAKELAFKSREDVVDWIFGNQDEGFFFPGPRQQRSRDYE
ncbi:vicilin Jug r 6.0101-like [Hibiscus syriacus]|uniref:vicilin Jug r 6.0101-like n=1 Tax=Hibiscus syriacus TaxID=106335 RepID=UPI001921FB8F|nr:vicilin Jug r 6.0101-like [Hibiscus syriacus]